MNILITAAVRVFGALSQLMMTLAVTNAAGITGAGKFLFAFAVVTILATVSRLGSEISGLKNTALAKSQGEVWRVLRIRLVLVVITSTSFSTIFYVAFSAFARGANMDVSTLPVLRLLLVSVPAFAVLGLLAEIIKGLGKPNDGIIISNILTPVAISGGVLGYALISDVTAFNVATIACVSFYLGMFVAATRICSLIKRLPAAADPARASLIADLSELLRQAQNLVLVSSTSIIMQWIGSVFLGIFATSEDVAGFSVAVRMSIAVSIFHSAVTSMMSPKIAFAWANHQRADTAMLVKKTGMMILLPSILALLTLFAFATPIMRLFNPEFTAYALHLRVLIAGQATAAFISHCGIALAMMGYYAEARNTSVVAILALFTLMGLLIPPLSVFGAAIAMSLAVFLGHVAAVVYLQRRAGIAPLPTSVRDLRAVGGQRE